MALADSKKVPTMINLLAEAAEEARAAVAKMNAVKAKFQTHNPSVIGTPLEGKVGIVNTALIALAAETSKTVWTQMIAAKVPSHRNKALD